MDSNYLNDILKHGGLKQVVDRLVQILRRKNAPEFDAIACCGCSGFLVAPAVALRLKKNLIIIRKSIANCHSRLLVEGPLNTKKYIIIDDLIDKGNTIKKILKAMEYENSICVGIYLYNDYRSSSPKNKPALIKVAKKIPFCCFVVNGKIRYF